MNLNKSRTGIRLAAVLCAASFFLPGCERNISHKDADKQASDQVKVTEEWFTQSEAEESFDFGLDENWIYLNDLEYSLKDKLKCYLFIGTDHSGNENAAGEAYEGSMADFLLLAVLNKTEDTFGFLQINRDTIMAVPVLDREGEMQGYSAEQICTSHWYGASKQQGCANTVQAVSDLLGGLRIDGYYSIGMDEIAKLNHIIGGATVTIEDDFSQADPSLVMGETISLTDEQAYNYLHARIDVGEGDNESRMRRQRTYMEAVYDKVIDRVSSDKSFLEDITESFGESVVTDMNGDDFGEIREAMSGGQDLGILSPKGLSILGTLLKDGLEHMEFYTDEADLADIMTRLCNLKLEDYDDFKILEADTEKWEESDIAE